MRKTLLTLTLLLIIYPFAIANTYYVAVNGNDSNTGTINAPWGTWQKAFDSAQPGDTVYFRGGVWYPKTTTFQAAICLIDPYGVYQPSNPRGHTGTVSNPICYFNYPGEYPILDCKHVVAPGNFLTGIHMAGNINYINYKGLEIRNIWAHGKFDLTANGMSETEGSNFTFENMSIHDIAGRGMWIESSVGYFGITSDTTRVINSDFYNCADTLMTHPFNFGDGIKGSIAQKGGVIIVDGCRFWKCSDDGIDLSGAGVKWLYNSWAFDNGNDLSQIYTPDDGNGFKLGGCGDSLPEPNWTMTNCISAGNLRFAIHMLDYSPYYRDDARVYNSAFYKNDDGPWSFQNAEKPWQNTEFYNCISYKNTRRQIGLFSFPYPHSNNSWIFSSSSDHPYTSNPAVNITDDDFVSLDMNELKAPRKADNSLPDVNFMKLASNSELIDAGTITTLSGKIIGLPYVGSAPDIGAFESGNSSGLSKISTNNLGFTISPTLVEEEATFQFTGINSGKFHLEFYNLSGIKVFETEPVQINSGTNSKEVNLNTFKHGLYLCRLVCNKQLTSTLKFVKK